MIKEKAIIVDIDGTLTNLNHRLIHLKKNPKEMIQFYEKIPLDAPRGNVIEIVKQLSKKYFVLFVTGRPQEYEEETIAWLKKFAVRNKQTFALYMRRTKDYRPDRVIKKEIYNKEIKEFYEIIAIFEDRTRVVNMWRMLGLTCFQVDQWDESK